MNHLEYGLAPKDVSALHVSVPIGLSKTEQLWSFFNTRLSFPYFGANWNSFSDLLRDLSWIEHSPVFLEHQEIPKLGDDTETYIGLLNYCVGDWMRDKAKLRVFFPVTAKIKLDVIVSKQNGLR